MAARIALVDSKVLPATPSITPESFTSGGTTAFNGEQSYGYFGLVAAVDLLTCAPASTVTAVNSDPPFPPVWPYPTGLIYGREFFSMNLDMIRGDNFSFSATIYLDGSPVNITGFSFRCTAKHDYNDLDASAVFSKTVGSGITITDGPNGVIRVQLVPADTSGLPAHDIDLVYDIQMRDASSNVYTVLRGILTVKSDVSITVP